MEAETKRRKLNPPPRRATKTAVSATENNSKVILPQNVDAHLKLQQARNFAISQAQQDGSTANFKIFDSPYGNFLIPAVPTRAELSS